MIQEIVNHLIHLGHVVLDSSADSITTKHAVAGSELIIKGELGKSFPFDAPEFYLLDRNKYGLLAHVGWPSEGLNEGLICDGSTDALALNAEDPSLVYSSLLMGSVTTVARVLSEDVFNLKECLLYFVGHW